MTRRDWTLLAIAAARGEPITPIQLQKSLFLLRERRSTAVGERFHKFTPHNYGPFAKSVYVDAEKLQTSGDVHVDTGDGRWSEFSATAKGLNRAEVLRSTAPVEGVEYLGRAVAWTRSLSFEQLVKAIYDEFPEQRANSVFRY